MTMAERKSASSRFTISYDIMSSSPLERKPEHSTSPLYLSRGNNFYREWIICKSVTWQIFENSLRTISHINGVENCLPSFLSLSSSLALYWGLFFFITTDRKFFSSFPLLFLCAQLSRSPSKSIDSINKLYRAKPIVFSLAIRYSMAFHLIKIWRDATYLIKFTFEILRKKSSDNY